MANGVSMVVVEKECVEEWWEKCAAVAGILVVCMVLCVTKRNLLCVCVHVCVCVCVCVRAEVQRVEFGQIETKVRILGAIEIGCWITAVVRLLPQHVSYRKRLLQAKANFLALSCPVCELSKAHDGQNGFVVGGDDLEILVTIHWEQQHHGHVTLTFREVLADVALIPVSFDFRHRQDACWP